MSDRRALTFDDRGAQALLDLASVASTRPLEEVFDAVAQTLLQTVGYRTVVLNVFHPEWDHYEATFIVGGQESRDLLLGSRLRRDVIDRLLQDADRCLSSAYFFAASQSSAWEEIETVYEPDLESSDDPERWQPEDALLVALCDTDGEPLGLASLDEPENGRRPSDEDLRLTGLICSYAEYGLRLARRAAAAEDEKRLLSCLNEVSPRLSACASLQRLHALLIETLVAHFGFGRVAIYQHDEADGLRLLASYGWESPQPLPLKTSWLTISTEMERSGDESGCWLTASQVLVTEPRAQPAVSRRNGQGPRGWSNHWLLIPSINEQNESVGIVVLDDPADRLIPSLERRRTLRLLIDLAASIANGIRQREWLDRLASHDTLTGVHNRRDLDRALGEHPDVAVLLCDLDSFKHINDSHGHAVGDRILAAFGESLRGFVRTGDTAIRFGGDEFCVILPNTDLAGAQAAADRLRTAATSRLAAVIAERVGISIGIAVRMGGSPDVHTLLVSADQHLYEAKRSGRDRVCSGEDP